jgi:DNA invertase Pin-like site-specific DNA recombinase
MALAEEQIRIAFEQSEKEVMDLRQRTSEGMFTAKLSGKQIGQKEGRHLEVKKAKKAKAYIIQYSKDFSGHMSDAALIELCNVTRKTYYKYKKELKEEQP